MIGTGSNSGKFLVPYVDKPQSLTGVRCRENNGSHCLEQLVVDKRRLLIYFSVLLRTDVSQITTLAVTI